MVTKMTNKLIKQVDDLKLLKDEFPFIIEVIPNDGLIYEGMNQAIITFSEELFTIYLFKGLIRKKFTGEVRDFKFKDITDIEFGKYSFKHPYVKISFNEEEYLVFSYFLKIKNHQKQEDNLKVFFKKLADIKNKQNQNSE